MGSLYGAGQAIMIPFVGLKSECIHSGVQYNFISFCFKSIPKLFNSFPSHLQCSAPRRKCPVTLFHNFSLMTCFDRGIQSPVRDDLSGTELNGRTNESSR